MGFIAVYITFPNQEEAQSICKTLLEKQLIACANISKVDSMYVWESDVVNEPEFVAICKTKKIHLDAINEAVLSLHSYDVPCITSWDIVASKEYGDWVLSCLAN